LTGYTYPVRLIASGRRITERFCFDLSATLSEGGPTMPKVLKCGDLMPGCNTVIEGKDEAEVMAKGAEHAKTAHKMENIPPDMAAKVKAAIKDK
jgi:predicted small metal-binding protein